MLWQRKLDLAPEIMLDATATDYTDPKLVDLTMRGVAHQDNACGNRARLLN